MDRESLGPYQLLEEIGAGGMGTVYLARHRETQALAAIKVLPPTLAREEGFVMRFTREAEMLRSLTNPHVVRLLDSGVDDETYYFVMEYVDGETLAQCLRRDRRLPWERAFDVAVQLCSALKAAHDAGIIHRDLKPSNVLLSKDGTVKLTDFGVAQLFASERLTITGGVIGTAEYMSPEQAQGQRATKRSDLYALGALLYAMLTGRPPFTGQTAMDVMHKQRFGQFDLPSRYVPELPPAVDEIMQSLLEKSPDKRPPDAFVASRRLQDVLRRTQMVSVDDATPTDAVGTKPAQDGPGPATFMRDLVRAEVQRTHEPTFLQRILNNTFVLLTMLIGLGLFVWWMATPGRSPEWSLREAQRILNGPAGSEWLRARDELLLPLVQTEAGRKQWAEQAQPLLDEIEAYEIEQRVLSPRRRSKPGSEIERLLIEAHQFRKQGDPARAQQRLAFLLIFADEYPALERLIQRWQAEIKDELPQILEERRSFIQTSLDRAAAMAPQDRRAAQEIWDGLLEIYGDDDCLAEEMRRVRQLRDASSENAR